MSKEEVSQNRYNVTSSRTSPKNPLLVKSKISNLAWKANLLQLITNSLPILIAYVDRDLHYQFVNEGYEK